jgi:integrase
MKKDRVDLGNTVIWTPDSKDAQWCGGGSAYLFPSDKNQSGRQRTLKTVWHKTLKRAEVSYFRSYDLRSTCATRLSAGGVVR